MAEDKLDVRSLSIEQYRKAREQLRRDLLAQSPRYRVTEAVVPPLPLATNGTPTAVRDLTSEQFMEAKAALRRALAGLGAMRVSSPKI